MFKKRIEELESIETNMIKKLINQERKIQNQKIANTFIETYFNQKFSYMDDVDRLAHIADADNTVNNKNKNYCRNSKYDILGAIRIETKSHMTDTSSIRLSNSHEDERNYVKFSIYKIVRGNTYDMFKETKREKICDLIISYSTYEFKNKFKIKTIIDDIDSKEISYKILQSSYLKPVFEDIELVLKEMPEEIKDFLKYGLYNSDKNVDFTTHIFRYLLKKM